MQQNDLWKQIFILVMYSIFVLSLESCAPWALYTTPPVIINQMNVHKNSVPDNRTIFDPRGLPSSYPSKDLDYEGNDRIDSIIDSFYK